MRTQKIYSYLVAIITLFFINISAQTQIGEGNVSGTWTKASSPYLVNGNIKIDTTETLTIEPGVEIIVSDNSAFHVFGQILAVGTESDSIIFTAADKNIGWDGLRFFDTDSTLLDSSRISYASFSYGKASTGTDKERAGGVMSIEASSKLVISNSSFYNNTSYGGETYGGGAIYIEKCSPIITNSIFKNNKSKNFDGGAILLFYSSTKISYSKFNNNIANENGGAIMSLHSAPQILNSEFIENTAGGYGGAICMDGVSSSGIINFDSSNPYFFNDSSNVVLKYLTIKNNTAKRGGGIVIDANFENDDFPIDFSLSEIIGNSAENGAALYFVEMNANSIPIRNLRISKNTTSDAIVYYNGGNSHDFLALTNCIIDHNYVVDASTSFTSVFDGYSIKLVNCVVADNKCNQVVDSEIRMTIENSIIWHNDGGLIFWSDNYSYAQYSIVQYPWSHFENGEGLKHSDPLFIDHENGNYHLSEGSPAIDNGNPTTNYFDKMLAPDAGLGTLANDMGAYGGKLNAWAEQPIANFTADTTKGESPLEVHFKSLALGSPKEFSWDFDGDGHDDSHLENPTHIFTESGTYTVRLAVNSFEYADTIIFKDYIAIQGNDVSGAVSGNWFLDTIRIVGDIYIPKNSTLTINPGTYVYFTGEYKFDVYGTLIARGTETDSIFFCSDSLGEISSYPYYAGFWYGITFHSTDENGQTPSSLDYCNIKYAFPTWLDEASTQFNSRFGGGLVFYKSTIDVSNTKLYDCYDSGSFGGGVFTSIYSSGNIQNVSMVKSGSMTLLSSNVNIESLNTNSGFGFYSDSSKVKIKNSIFNNSSQYTGRGVHSENSEVEMTDCKISNYTGDGIRAEFSSFKIEHVLIKNNGGDGAIFLESPSTIANCEIIGNSLHGLRFQTVQNWGTTFTSEINNCVVAKNGYTGIKFWSRNTANITNCTIADNTNSSGWGGVLGGEIKPHLNNCIVYNNGNDLDFQADGLYTYSIIQGNYIGSDTATTNLQNVDPLFRDAANNDYHLQSIACGNAANSPGIDAGDPNIGDLILDCASAGLGTKLSDIGAYGGEGNWWDKSILPNCHFMGEVSGTWDCETITIDGDIVIPEGDTLIISEAVDRVLISGPYQIKVKGVLLAIGSEREGVTKLDTDYIKFQGENWKGIFFNNLNNTNVGTSIIANCRFDYANKMDMTYQGGGAILIYNSDKVEIKHSLFYANSAMYGGAMYIENSNPRIEDCYFELNGKERVQNGTALTTAGGALYIKTSNPYLHKLQFINNYSISGGGAIVVDNSTTTIRNLLLAENRTEGMGGAIEVFSNINGSLLKVVNMTSTNNISKSNGGGSFHTYGENTELEVINSIMYDNTKVELYVEGKTPVITYSIIEGDSGKAHFGIGCLDKDPLLESTTGNIYRLGTSLLGYSPAIDAGHPDSLDTELDCYAGLGTNRADMGYYGGRYSDNATDVEEENIETEIPSKYELSQNYPNPFNPSTTINYSIPVVDAYASTANVTLKVYDILGREVATLVNKEQSPGNYSVRFDASNLTSGLYFYRLTAGKFTSVKKMMLLK